MDPQDHHQQQQDSQMQQQSSSSQPQQHIPPQESNSNINLIVNQTPVVQNQASQQNQAAMQQEDWQSDHEQGQSLVDDDQEVSDDSDQILQVDIDADGEEFGIQIGDMEGQNDAKNIVIKAMNVDGVKQYVGAVFDKLKKLPKLTDLIKLPPSKQITRQICAKLIKRTDTVIQCYDCRMDATCIICLQCFKNGNHEGHRYVVKQFAGGCCDCGDPEAWSQKGFCKFHSGQFKDFEIDEKIVSSFSRTINGLMYLYFHQVINKNESSEPYAVRLIQFFEKINTDNTYYNKLTALCLTKRLPSELSLNEQLDKKTILQNILTSRISGRYFNRWFNIFISMFSYYPFKLAILKHYIQNYGDIVDGKSNSINYAISISCQLITSFKLIEQYCQQNKIGVGQRSKKPHKTSQIKNYYTLLTHDLSSLTLLSENASLLYWKMHINSQEGIKNIFYYYPLIMKKVALEEQQKTETQICSTFINFTELQFNLLQIFAGVLRIISGNQELLSKVIYQLWAECEKTWLWNPELLCTLRPYERCLGMALFTYFNFSLDDISARKQKIFKEVLKISEEAFYSGCSRILNRILKTLFFYAKTQALPGLGQTMYGYLYIYRTHSRILSTSDLLCAKIILLLIDQKFPVTLQSIIEMDRNKLQNDAYLKQKTDYFISVLKVVKNIYTHCCPEIYIAYAINSQANLYQKQIKQLILGYFKELNKQDSYSVNQNDIKSQLISGILSDKCKMAETWLKSNCVIDKNKKCYILKSNLYEQQLSNIIGINFDDFWINASSKDAFADFPKSVAAVSGYNLAIFNMLWNQISEKSLKNIIEALHCEKNQSNLEAILPILCTIYNLKTSNKQMKMEQQSQSQQIVRTILKRFNKRIPSKTLSLLELQKSEQNKESEQALKKQRMAQIRAKKLESMKKKQESALVRNMQVEQKQSQKLQKMESEQLDNSDKCCCICRKQLNENSVYIVNVDIRNHSKLFNIGVSVQCMSFTSCQHVFDLACISKSFRGNSLTSSVSCPLCKKIGNLLFPACYQSASKFAQNVAERVLQILKQIKKNPNFYQEIIKSFYHYVLLCSVDMERTTAKRAQIYRSILAILKKSIPENQVEMLRQKFAKNLISLQFDKDLQEKKNENNTSSISFFLNMLANQGRNIGNLQNLIVDIEANRDDSIKQPKKERNKVMEKFVQTKQMTIRQKEQDNSGYTLFKETVEYILDYVSTREHQQYPNKKQPSQSSQRSKNLIQKYLSPLTENSNTKIDYQIEKKPIQILKQLPQKYTALGQLKKCSSCSEITGKLLTCLICDWNGCQDCQNGYAKNHVNCAHGQVGAMLLVQKGVAYYIVNDRSIEAGRLYEDQWGNGLKGATNWDEFELNRKLYEQMDNMLKLDEIPLRKSKTSQL